MLTWKQKVLENKIPEQGTTTFKQRKKMNKKEHEMTQGFQFQTSTKTIQQKNLKKESQKYQFTSMFLILRGSRLSKNFKIDKTQRHKPQSKSRHHAGKSHKQHNYPNVYKEPWFTTSVLHRHSNSIPSKIFRYFFFFPFPPSLKPNANTKKPKQKKERTFFYATKERLKDKSYKAKRCIPQTCQPLKKRGKKKMAETAKQTSPTDSFAGDRRDRNPARK